ncbi:Asp23/Gls24 family envelope stress response protein [Ornithinimicrobium sp. Arc0846-15]|nr:Asp23/Gls24 family envelope stress response protein [Ornithinimicrobium laminariae]
MAEGEAPQEATDDKTVALAEAETRGTLTVKSAVVTQVVEHLARKVKGVVSRAGTFSAITGSRSPHADIRHSGRTAHVTMNVEVQWPAPVASIAEEIRSQILTEGARLTGTDIRQVDVEVGVVAPPEPEAEPEAPARRVL